MREDTRTRICTKTPTCIVTHRLWHILFACMRACVLCVSPVLNPPHMHHLVLQLHQNGQINANVDKAFPWPRNLST